VDWKKWNGYDHHRQLMTSVKGNCIPKESVCGSTKDEAQLISVDKISGLSSLQCFNSVEWRQEWHPDAPIISLWGNVAQPRVTPEMHTHTHTPVLRPFSRTTRVRRYQKGKTNLDITEARDSEWQWHQLGHMLVCTSLQADNHASTPPLSFLQAGCPSCSPTNSVKALKG